jgi:hypothetical protein
MQAKSNLRLVEVENENLRQLLTLLTSRNEMSHPHFREKRFRHSEFVLILIVSSVPGSLFSKQLFLFIIFVS